MRTSCISIVTLTCILASCSTYQRPESFEEKMGRYEARDTTNLSTPDMGIVPFRVASRGISSEDSDHPNTGLESYSNKRVYFLTLLSQYNTLKSYASQAPDIQICPSFHTAITNNTSELKSQSVAKNDIPWSIPAQDNLANPDYVAAHPELALPISLNGPHPSVLDSISEHRPVDGAELMGKAFHIQLEKMYSELAILCETGQSNNYYAFENLINHMKQHPEQRKGKDGMTALMKTTLFINMALIQSIESSKSQTRGRGIASTPKSYSVFEEETMNRLDADWAKDYFTEMKARRSR